MHSAIRKLYNEKVSLTCVHTFHKDHLSLMEYVSMSNFCKLFGVNIPIAVNFFMQKKSMANVAKKKFPEFFDLQFS